MQPENNKHRMLIDHLPDAFAYHRIIAKNQRHHCNNNGEALNGDVTACIIVGRFILHA